MLVGVKSFLIKPNHRPCEAGATEKVQLLSMGCSASNLLFLSWCSWTTQPPALGLQRPRSASQSGHCPFIRFSLAALEAGNFQKGLSKMWTENRKETLGNTGHRCWQFSGEHESTHKIPQRVPRGQRPPCRSPGSQVLDPALPTSHPHDAEVKSGKGTPGLRCLLLTWAHLPGKSVFFPIHGSVLPPSQPPLY